ncbi:MAG: nitrogenase component 1 [Synergistaceae bacterium]|jgi:nitrogenase molybdenum-iron protein alpha chain|nr:nitrogenase component 1 [Synergistaceae bacterium]
MSYYEQAAPPVRDQRLKIGDSFAGSAREMLECAKSGCMLQRNRLFWQTGACQMALTIMMAATVERSAIVMHGPIGCGTQLHALCVQTGKGKTKRGKQPEPPAWLSTNLQESDVIGGGELKLREAIEYADREFRPEIIFVVSTCAPNIIGDDVEEIVRRAKESSAAHVVSLHCPGFKSRVVASAYDAFYHGLLRHLPLEPEPWRDFVPHTSGRDDFGQIKYAHIKARTVNLWNATSIGPGDEGELERLLGALGLKTRVFAEYSNADEFRLVSQAALNVSMCDVHDDYMLSFLKEKFGTPYIMAGMPIGFHDTRQWLKSIAARFGLENEADRLADNEEAAAREAIAPFLPKIQGKRVLLCGGVVRVGTEAIFLKELGMEVLTFRAYHYESGAEKIYERVADELPCARIAVSNQLFEFCNQIKRLKPDLVISHNGTQGILAKLGVPSIQLFDVDRSFFGYAGVFSLLQRIAFAFRNTSYQKRLSAHVKFPYRESWYDMDAFHYIKD